jgi:hypothetical protein
MPPDLKNLDRQQVATLFSTCIEKALGTVTSTLDRPLD